LKLFPRALFLDLPYFDHMHRFLPALVLREGGIVRSVPVNHRPRRRGVSKYGVLDRLGVGIVDLFGVLWLCRRFAMPELVEPELVEPELVEPELVEMETTPAEATPGEIPVRNAARKLRAARPEPAL
jgi:dolichol-phosphate mannosyltransferase